MTYRWVDHTAELELEIAAPSQEEVLAEALTALAELLGTGTGEPERRELVAEAPDLPALLAAWMEELVYLSEDAELVPEGLERLDLGEGRLEATVLARPGRPRHLVKAVTYHRLDFRSDGDMWVARVVLDV